MSRPQHYTLTAGAENDLRQARAWSRKRWGKEQTRQYFKDLQDGAEHLGKNHKSFRPRSELAGDTGLKLYPVREHYLVYEPVMGKHVIIVAVIRQSRDIPALLRQWTPHIKRELKDIRTKIKAGEISV